MSSFSRSADSLPAETGQTARETAPAARPLKLSRAEWIVLALALIALAVLRWFSVTSHRWNSDESQHLHVVWAWTVGKLQYLDIFDNHTPLFHILNAPLLKWLGERADIIKRIHRGLTAQQIDRSVADFVLDDDGRGEPIVGRFVARGLAEYLIVQFRASQRAADVPRWRMADRRYKSQPAPT